MNPHRRPLCVALIVLRFRALFGGLLICALVLTLPSLACAQHQVDKTTRPTLGPEESLEQGRQLVNDLLTQKPQANATNTGVVRIRNAQDQEREIPVKFEIYATRTNWISVYRALPADGFAGEKLTVIHDGTGPNQYYVSRGDGTAAAKPARLSAGEVMVPFAGSDFWVADLGLEFLHWPNQKVLTRELRHGQPCAVLESINPKPARGSYARVVSWVDTDNGGMLHADAYDDRGQRMKEFDPTGLKKVNGQRQLEEMEMRNLKAGSHTWIKFDLAQQG